MAKRKTKKKSKSKTKPKKKKEVSPPKKVRSVAKRRRKKKGKKKAGFWTIRRGLIAAGAVTVIAVGTRGEELGRRILSVPDQLVVLAKEHPAATFVVAVPTIGAVVAPKLTKRAKREVKSTTGARL